MLNKFTPYFILLFFIFLTACQSDSGHLFQLKSARQTGIDFVNSIQINELMNILTFEYIYNGGGVGVGDFNNDDLPDLYFTANMGTNKLYLNKGNFNFQDITETAQVGAINKWTTGISVVDINQDGWQDLYVCVTGFSGESRQNLLYINNGLNENGVPTFTESALACGIADNGHSMMGAFFDYDNDDDLDLYVLSNQLDTRSPNKYRVKQNNGYSPGTDQLYRNDGNDANGLPQFTNVGKEVGILYEGYGLGINITDFNEDGWKDIYITNNYLTNDLLYINNQDGTFSNNIEQYVKHQAHSAMGNDVGDINNDGYPDIVAVDRLPYDNQRRKKTMPPYKYSNYVNNEKLNYEYQYMRNMLHLNNGPTPEGNHWFSEIGMLAGIYATDWSWAPLLADYDNDGQRDLFISNGFPNDITDQDFIAFRNVRSLAFDRQSLLDAIPVVKISNFMYRNQGDLQFDNVAEDWGLDEPSFSNGAAYVDLDRDGDLDIVVNNINDAAFVYENRTNQKEKAPHYLQVKLEGKMGNRDGFGAKIWLEMPDGQLLLQEVSPYRGYLSSIDPVIHFGLGTQAEVKSLRVLWPDGQEQIIQNPTPDKLLTLQYQAATAATPSISNPSKAWLSKATQKSGLAHLHYEHVFMDFNIQRLLPHQFSQSGPAISIGDIDGNGEEDCYLGGSLAIPGVLFFQKDGQFSSFIINGEEEKPQEDMGTLLFDADGDNDLDLYTVSGGYEQQPKDLNYRDRLFINDGKGFFKKADDEALPKTYTSGSCVRAADYDQDGDLDLFVGGRVFPGNYPLPVESYLLRNDSKDGQVRFTNVNDEVCPELNKLGIVNDALWTDFDNDGQIDLIAVGEWMPLTFFKNENGKLTNVTQSSGIANQTGWWNSLAAGDFDHDGDIDYVAGNLGSNTMLKADAEHPVMLYAADYDKNLSWDPILACYLPDSTGVLRPYPIHSKDDLGSQLVMMKKRFLKYGAYSRATIDDLFTPEEIQASTIYKATHMQSSYIENKGDGTFALSVLPIEAQLAPVYGMSVKDINEDGHLDVLMVGNAFDTDLINGRYDALNGLVLLGDGKGHFASTKYQQSGFIVPGDAKALVSVASKDQDLIIATVNQDSLRIFQRPQASNQLRIQPKANDASAIIYYEDGSTRRHEFYYGMSFLSQTSRILYLPKDKIKSVEIIDFQGNKRDETPNLIGAIQ